MIVILKKLNIARFFKHLVSHTMALILVVSNCFISYAQATTITPDTSRENRVYMDKSANGTPVVNINDPNLAGISHNYFLNYSVSSKGAILNNSSSNTVSEIGGVTLGNSNLTKSAMTIINEVTGTSRSIIAGPQEIVGQSANYILANPNGITINGAEFINAHEAVLTTGVPVLGSSGSLEKFLVEGGDIKIENKDLDLTNLSYFGVIAKVVSLNAKIHAGREAEISNGSGEYLISEGNFKENSSKVSSGLSLDSSALGGMYAGKIKLTSSEIGVGVNIPDLAASTGNIDISASGKITHKNIRAAGSLAVESKGSKISVKNNSRAEAAGSITYKSSEEISVGSSSALISNTGISVKSSALENNGVIFSNGQRGIDINVGTLVNNGTIFGEFGDITTNAQKDISNLGAIASSGRITFGFGNNFDNYNQINAAQGLDFYNGNYLLNRETGVIKTGGNSNFNVTNAFINKGQLVSILSSDINAGDSVVNTGHISATSLNIKSAENVANIGDLISINDLVISAAGSIENSRNIVSAKGNITIATEAENIVNAGNINSALSTTIPSKGDLLNSGYIFVAGGKTQLIVSGELENDGKIEGRSNVELEANGNILIRDAGIIDSYDDLIIRSKAGNIVVTKSTPDIHPESGVFSRSKAVIYAAQGISNINSHIEVLDGIKLVSSGHINNSKGRIISDNEITIKTDQDFANSGQIQGEGYVRISGEGKLDNTGNIIAKKALEIVSKNNINNSGNFQSENNIQLSSISGSFVNNGSSISANGSFTAEISGLVDNFNGVIETAKEISIKSGSSITNSGIVYSRDEKINLASNGSIDLLNTGNIQGVLGVEINSTAGSIDNAGGIASLGGDINVLSLEAVRNSGLIQSTGVVSIISINDHVVNEDGKVFSGSRIELIGSEVINTSTNEDFGYIQSDGNISMKANSGKLHNSGTVISDGTINFLAEGDVINDKNIQSKLGGLISSNSANVTNNHLIFSPGKYEIRAGGRLVNNGNIETSNVLLKGSIDVENNGQIRSRNLEISDSITFNNTAYIEFEHFELSNNIRDFKNSDTGILKGGSFVATLNDFANPGEIEVIDKINLKINNFSSKLIKAGADSEIIIAGAYNSDGNIYLPNSKLKLEAENIDNTGIIKAGSLVAIARNGNVENQNIVFGESSVNLSAANGNVSNSGHIITAGDLRLFLSGQLNNRHGLYGRNLVEVKSDSINNVGEIKSAKTIDIHSNIIDNDGLIAGRDSVSIASALTNTGEINSQKLITISTSSAVSNSGEITSHNDLSIDSNSLVNTGIIQAVGALKSNQIASITNDNSIYGTAIDLSTGGDLINIARIIAQDSLSLTADQDIINKQEISLLRRGKLSIRAGRDIRNDRDYDVTYVDMARRGDFPVDATDSSTENHNPGRAVGTFKLTTRTDKNMYDDKLHSIEDIIPMISSAGTLALHAGRRTDNSAANIYSKGDIEVSGGSLLNRDIVLQRHTHNAPHVTYKEWWKEKDSLGSRIRRVHPNRKVWKDRTIGPNAEATYITRAQVDRIPSVIQSGGILRGNLAGEIANGSADSSDGVVGVTLSDSVVTNAKWTNFDPQTDSPTNAIETTRRYDSDKDISAKKPTNIKSLPESSAANISLERRLAKAGANGNISMPLSNLITLAEKLVNSYKGSTSKSTGVSWDFDDTDIMAAFSGSNWDKPNKPGKYYIKETSPVFTDEATYFSTDNFIERVEGFNPKSQPKNLSSIHLGDARKQADFVKRQIADLTGLGSLDDSLDYKDQIKSLYEAGIKQAKELKLSAGVALTKEQVASLTEDIVWAEELELNGTKVVVPRVYVANSKSREKATGMIAKGIDIEAKSIHNSSSITAEAVRLNAKDGDIENFNGGDIYSSKYLELDAKGKIRNVGSSLTSDGVGQIKAGGNIENITESRRIGDEKNHWTQIDDEASINIKGPLLISSKGNFLNKGSTIDSGDLLLNIAGHFTNESIENSSSLDVAFGDSYRKERSVVYKKGRINSAGKIKGFIGGNFNLIGSTMESVGDASFKIAGDANVYSLVESHELDIQSKHKGGRNFMGGKNTENYAHKSLAQKLSTAGVKSGGQLTIETEGKQTYFGSVLKGADGRKLKGQKISLLAAGVNNYSSTTSYSENEFTVANKAKGFSDTTHELSQLEGGGKTEIDAKEVAVDHKKGTKPSWARQLEIEGGITWNPLENEHDEWNVSKTQMSAGLTTLVAISAGIATSWAGGFGAFAVAPATLMSTAGGALATGLASRGAVALINNGFDITKAAKEVTSKEALKSLAIDIVTAGITYGATNMVGLQGVTSEMTRAQRFTTLAQKGLVNTAVRASLSKFSGEKIEDIAKSEAISAGLASAQSVVGDIAAEYEIDDGSFLKTAMHGALGTAYSAITGGSLAAGAIGGVTSELVPEIMGSGTGETGPPSEAVMQSVAKMTSATITFLAGGTGKDISASGTVAVSALEYNRRLHPEEQKILMRLQRGKSSEERQRLAEAAAALIKASKGVDENDPNYGTLAQMEEMGKTHAAEIAMLKGEAIASGQGDLFEYGIKDRANDFVSRNDEYVERGVGLSKAGLGAAGILGAAGLDLTGAGSIIGVPLGVASGYQFYEGSKQLVGNYTYTEGAKTLESFSGAMPSYSWERGSQAATELALAGAAAGASKLAATVGKKLMQSEIGKSVVRKTKDLADDLTEKMFGGPKFATAGGPNPGIVFNVNSGEQVKGSNLLFNKGNKVVGGSTKSDVGAPLLPNEGKVGSYKELTKKYRVTGDNLTPHHIPSAGYMKSKGVKNSEGISIMVEQPTPGKAGRHRRTDTYGKKTDFSKAPRDELAKDILDLRKIYKEDGVYTPEIRKGLIEVIDQNKNKFPEIFNKSN